MEGRSWHAQQPASPSPVLKVGSSLNPKRWVGCVGLIPRSGLVLRNSGLAPIQRCALFLLSKRCFQLQTCQHLCQTAVITLSTA